MAMDYKVLSQRQNTQLTADGRFIETMDVTFEVAQTGNTGTISVPVSAYTVENVRPLIEERVSAMRAIADL